MKKNKNLMFYFKKLNHLKFFYAKFLQYLMNNIIKNRHLPIIQLKNSDLIT
jgi:hypothetical protein